MSRPKGSLNKATVSRQTFDSATQAHKDVVATSIAATKVDSWSNVLSGLGGKSDKSKYTEFGELNLIDDVGLSNIYMNDGLGGRIIDVIADDMTREWISMENDDNEESVEVINDVLVDLSAEEHYNEAIKWQRLYGGSLLIVGAMDGSKPDTPLREDKIKNIEYLKVVDRTNIQICDCEFDVNPMSPMFGKIILYHVDMYVGQVYIPMKIHYTRVIPFFNDPIPSRIRSNVSLDMRYWGMSSLQRIFEELRDLGGITQSTVNILYEFIIGKYKISHLAEIMSQPGGERAVVNRMEIMNMSKSVLNSVMIDSEEDYSRDYATLAGLAELIDRFMLKLSGSTGIPVTRLFGRSPAGLNATGENDLRNYYDLVEANQRNKLFPPIRRLIQLICKWKGIETVPEIEFNSLYQLSEEEKVKIEKMEAETAKFEADTNSVYVQMGALDPDEVRQDTLGKTGSVAPEEPTPEELAALVTAQAPTQAPTKTPTENTPKEKAVK